MQWRLFAIALGAYYKLILLLVALSDALCE